MLELGIFRNFIRREIYDVVSTRETWFKRWNLSLFGDRAHFHNCDGRLIVRGARESGRTDSWKTSVKIRFFNGLTNETHAWQFAGETRLFWIKRNKREKHKHLFLFSKTSRVSWATFVQKRREKRRKAEKNENERKKERKGKKGGRGQKEF